MRGCRVTRPTQLHLFLFIYLFTIIIFFFSPSRLSLVCPARDAPPKVTHKIAGTKKKSKLPPQRDAIYFVSDFSSSKKSPRYFVASRVIAGPLQDRKPKGRGGTVRDLRSYTDLRIRRLINSVLIVTPLKRFTPRKIPYSTAPRK